MADAFLGHRLLSALRLARWERRIEAAAGRALDARKTAAMATTRMHVMTAALVPPDAFDLAEWDGEVADEVEPVVAAVLTEVGDTTLSFLSLPPDQRAAILGRIDIESMAASFTERIRNVGPITAERLQAVLTEGIGLGEGIDKLAARIDEVFTRAASSAATIARTETHGAAEYTSYTTAGEVARGGIPLLKTWLATEDERTRETHSEADGQQVPLDEPFDVGGEELWFPGDPDGSADETVNCRCSCVYEEAGGGETEVESEE